MIKNYLHYAVAAAFAVASGASNLAFAVGETEPNDSFSLPQRLVIDDSRTVVVTGIVGVKELTSPVVPDIDYYSFHGRAGDVVTVDIDFGFKGAGAGERSVDTLIAIWGPGLFRSNDDPSTGDPDSIDRPRRDARLDQVVFPANGVYTVGVTSAGTVGGVPRKFLPDGSATAFVANSVSNGSYKLIISGVSPSVKQINIDIKPGATSIARINPKSRGSIPVALLSSDDFDALKADSGSVRFGPSGTEATALRCGKGGEDVNGDGRLDLVCHFDNQAAAFDPSDEEGIVTGTIGGMPFEGRGDLKVIQVKRQD
jgi:hypothetical protein